MENKTLTCSKNIVIDFADYDSGEILAKLCKTHTFFGNGDGEKYLHEIIDCVVRGLRSHECLCVSICIKPVADKSVKQELFIRFD